MKPKTIALYGLLVSLALILSYVEAQLPAFFAVPGMKLGLTNVVVLLALYRRNARAALCINLVRILLAALLFGTGMSLAYSLAGGMLSWVVMVLLRRSGRFAAVTVSIAGGVFHNLGQILMAMLLLETPSLLWYFAVLWFSGLASGALIGLLGGLLIRRLPDMEGGAHS